MSEKSPAREDRPVRIETIEGAVEGCLNIGPQIRTLDELNMSSKRFVTIYYPKSVTGEWNLGVGPLAVEKESILFVRELAAPAPGPVSSTFNFTRAAVHLRVNKYEVEGFLHVPPGGMVMKRLEQDNHRFLSVTTVLLTGPGEPATMSFLAVNRNFITTAQVAEPNATADSPAGQHVAFER